MVSWTESRLGRVTTLMRAWAVHVTRSTITKAMIHSATERRSPTRQLDNADSLSSSEEEREKTKLDRMAMERCIRGLLGGVGAVADGQLVGESLLRTAFEREQE